MTKVARLVARGAHRDWCCPACGKLMAKVYDDRAVVKTGNVFASFALSADVTLTCPKCATETRAAGEDVAA